MKIKTFHYSCRIRNGTMNKVQTVNQTVNASMKYFRLPGAVRHGRSAEGAHALQLATATFRDENAEIKDSGRGVKCTEEQGDPAGQRFSVSCVKSKLWRKICRYFWNPPLTL